MKEMHSNLCWGGVVFSGRWDADFGSCRSGYVARVGSLTRHEPARSGDDGGARTHARSLGLQYSERRVAGRRSKVVDVTWTACRQHLSPLSPARSTSTPRTHHPRSTAQCTTTSVAISIEPTLGTRLPHHHCTPHHTKARQVDALGRLVQVATSFTPVFETSARTHLGVVT
jgi:hypothetical protein